MSKRLEILTKQTKTCIAPDFISKTSLTNQRKDSNMIIRCGMYTSLSTEHVLIYDPEYVWRLFNLRGIYGELLRTKEDIERLIITFDSMPFKRKCFARNCKNQATRVSLVSRDSNLYYWCDECDIKKEAGLQCEPTVIKTYMGAVNFLHLYRATKSEFRLMIVELANAKGLPERKTEKALQRFFHKITSR